MLDNIEVAILTKLNDLAGRYSLKPYEFIATIASAEGQESVLSFEGPASGTSHKELQFERMLTSLGMKDEHVLKARDSEIIDVLDRALDRAPRSTFRS